MGFRATPLFWNGSLCFSGGFFNAAAYSSRLTVAAKSSLVQCELKTE
jgi:hypothetical protein